MGSVVADSANPKVPAVDAKHKADGPAVRAESANGNANVGAVTAINNGGGPGVFAKSANWNGVHAETGSDVAAVAAINTGKGPGVWAESANSNANDVAAVHAINKGAGPGVWAEVGLNCHSIDVGAVHAINNGGGQGVIARSANKNAVLARTYSNSDAAVLAENLGSGPGIVARSMLTTKFNKDAGAVDALNEGAGPGVRAVAISIDNDVAAVHAINKGAGPGIIAKSANWNGVHAETGSDVAAVAAINTGKGPGVWAESANGIAGHFEGDVEVAGDVILQNADCAEDFEISAAEQVDSGTVMAINDLGQLEPVKMPYDKRVAGVISGAGDLKPALVLGRRQGQKYKVPIALMGRVNCRVDADYGTIEVGDLLTTSATIGHAMKATDPIKAFGAVIGKALSPLKEGKGMIPILVALQ